MCRVHIALHIVQNMYYYTVFAPIQVSCFVNYLKQRAHDTLHMGKKMTTIKNYESHVIQNPSFKKSCVCIPYYGTNQEQCVLPQNLN